MLVEGNLLVNGGVCNLLLSWSLQLSDRLYFNVRLRCISSFTLWHTIRIRIQNLLYKPWYKFTGSYKLIKNLGKYCTYKKNFPVCNWGISQLAVYTTHEILVTIHDEK